MFRKVAIFGRWVWADPKRRAAAAALLGGLVSLLCEFAPVTFQGACHTATRVVDLMTRVFG